MLWDGIGDIIITSNVNNIFQGPIYRTIDYILQVSVLVELQLVVDQWTNTEAVTWGRTLPSDCALIGLYNLYFIIWPIKVFRILFRPKRLRVGVKYITEANSSLYIT